MKTENQTYNLIFGKSDFIEINISDNTDESIQFYNTWRKLKGHFHSSRNSGQNYNQLNQEDILYSIVNEEHHKSYGRPWILGRANFNFLQKIGLRCDHSVLDFGCGAGRHGIHLIPYLNSERYCGIDAHYQSLLAFATYENCLHNLSEKSPRLLWNENFELNGFGIRFDWILDIYTSWHIPRKKMPELADKMARALNKNGRILICPPDHIDPALFRDRGLHITERHTSVCNWLEGTPYRARTKWIELGWNSRQ